MSDLIQNKTQFKGTGLAYYVLLPKNEVKKAGKVYNMTTGEKII